jgi:hypothetical protein
MNVIFLAVIPCARLFLHEPVALRLERGRQRKLPISSRPGFGPVRPEPIAPGELLLLLHAEPTSLGHVSHSFQPRPAIGAHQVADFLSAAVPSAEPAAIRA